MGKCQSKNTTEIPQAGPEKQKLQATSESHQGQPKDPADKNLGDQLYDWLLQHYSDLPNFPILLAPRYLEVGTYNDFHTFREAWFSDLDSPTPQSLILGGTSHDVKVAEVAASLFAWGVEYSSSHGKDDDDDESKNKAKFQNVSNSTQALQDWVDSKTFGVCKQETERLMVELWLQDVLDAINAPGSFVDYPPEVWSEELRSLWKVDPDTKKTYWLLPASCEEDINNRRPMMLMIAMTKLYCCDIAPRKEEIKYIGSLDGDANEEEEAETLFISDYTVSSDDTELAVIEVESAKYDPDFEVHLWRRVDSNPAPTFVQICVIKMPLVAGHNQRVIMAMDSVTNSDGTAINPENLRPMKGDQLGWYSRDTSSIKYTEGGEKRVWKRGVPAWNSNEMGYHLDPKKKFIFEEATELQRSYAVRILEATQTWKDMHEAVKNTFDTNDDWKDYLRIANRTYFENESMDFVGPTQMTNAFKSYNFKEGEACQDRIDRRCKFPITINETEWKRAIPHDPKAVWTRQVTTEYGQAVRKWLEASKTVTLQNADIGTFQNVVTKQELSATDPRRSFQVPRLTVSKFDQKTKVLEDFWKAVRSQLDWDLFLEDNTKAWARLTVKSDRTIDLTPLDVEERDFSSGYKTFTVTDAFELELQVMDLLNKGGEYDELPYGYPKYKPAKTCMIALLTDDYQSVSGQLLKAVNDDPSPVGVTGHASASQRSWALPWWMSCNAPTVDTSPDMSATKLLQLEAPNPDQVNK